MEKKNSLKTLLSKNRPHHDLTEMSKMFGAMPDAVEVFERAFAEQMGATHGIAFPHCRVAIRAALETAPAPFDHVAMTAYSCIVVAHAIILAQKKPRFVDIDLEDFNSPVLPLMGAADSKNSTILVTHLYGNPVDLTPLDQLSQRSLFVIEDSALALKKAYRPTQPGVKSVSVYSFDFNKHLSSLYGGILVTHDDEVATRIRAWRDTKLKDPSFLVLAEFKAKMLAARTLFKPLAYTLFDRVRKIPILDNQVDNRSLDTPAFPTSANYKFFRAQARLALSQLGQADYFLKRRREISERYFSTLKGLSDLVPMKVMVDSDLSHYTVRVPNRDERHFREKMRKAGIEVGQTLDYCLPDLPLYKKFMADAGSQLCPNATLAAAEVINLPNYPDLSDAEFERVIRAVRLAI